MESPARRWIQRPCRSPRASKSTTHWADIERLDESDIATRTASLRGRAQFMDRADLRAPARRARGPRLDRSRGRSLPPGAIVALVHRDDANDFASGAHGRVPGGGARGPRTGGGVRLRDRAEPRRRRFEPRALRAAVAAAGPCARAIARAATASRASPTAAVRTSAPAWFSDPEFLRGAAAAEAIDVRAPSAHAVGRLSSTWTLALAARGSMRMHGCCTKPATKLYNAWLAGVPVLASPEPAYSRAARGSAGFHRDRIARDDVLRVGRPPARRSGRCTARWWPTAARVDGVRRGGGHASAGSTLLEGEVLPCIRGRVGDARRCAGGPGTCGAMAGAEGASRVHRACIGYQRAAMARDLGD